MFSGAEVEFTAVIIKSLSRKGNFSLSDWLVSSYSKVIPKRKSSRDVSFTDSAKRHDYEAVGTVLQHLGDGQLSRCRWGQAKLLPEGAEKESKNLPVKPLLWLLHR
ncbi:hypothetical protein OMCYN_01593 [cyanobiont of Ornithocercus magnificus]|nr:hypothetical protein OMCYN_01593 [cyanobiont of Ornithocercus magnificus]